MSDPVQHDLQLLIADDDPVFRETVLEIVEPYFPTIAVDSAERAIEVVESVPVDLALFDMHMHVLSGLDAIRWLRRRQVELPCILMSSHVTDELETQAMELNTFSVLRKPLRRDRLLEIIRLALGS